MIIGLMSLSAKADMKALQNELKLSSQKSNDSQADELLQKGKNMVAFNVEWPGGEDVEQSLVVVKWDGIPVEELNNVEVSIGQSGPFSVKHLVQGTVETWVFLPVGAREFTLNHPKYGSTTVKLSNIQKHDVWTVPVVLDKLMNVEIIPLTDYNKPVRVTLVNPETNMEQEAYSPAIFTNVAPGTYNLRFAIDGRIEDRTITVTPTQKVFGGEQFDFRHKKNVTLESTTPGRFFVDGGYLGEGNLISAELPYGTHTVLVKVDENLKTEKTIDVNNDSESIVYLSPVKSKTFEVVGMYQGKPVQTMISVPGLPENQYNSRVLDKGHQFTLPVDSRPYTYNLFYEGHRGSKEIKVTEGMNSVQEIKISADRKMIWPWQRDYENVNNWWEFSYVTKQYSTSGRLYDDGSSIKTTIKENGVWDDGYDKWLHGFRMGYHAQPAFKFGLGLYTGLFTEFYFSKTDESPIDVYDKYFEWDLSVPLHILYQLPLGKKFCVGFHTGPSFNVAVLGSYYDKLLPSDDDYDNVEDWTDFWDEPWAPSRFNVDWDFSLFIRWKKLMISGTLSSGLTNNKMHETFGADARTVMNKAVVAISIGL